MAGNDDLTRAQGIYQKGDPDGAADILESLLESEPDNAAARLLLARCYSRMRDGDAAAAEIEVVLEQNPDNAEAHLLRGAEYYFADDMDGATQELEQALELDPELAEAYVRLAQVHTDSREYDEAQEALDKAEALTKDDRDALAIVRMGQVYLALQQRDNDTVKKLVEENEELWADHPYASATVRSNLAVICARKRDYTRARELLIEALDLDPYFVTARGILGQIAAIQRDYPFAVDQLQQVVDNNEDAKAITHYILGSSLSALKRYPEANAQYKIALDKGLSGIPAYTARMSLLLPTPTSRMIVGGILLAIITVLAFQIFQPIVAICIAFGFALIGWQLMRGGY